MAGIAERGCLANRLTNIDNNRNYYYLFALFICPQLMRSIRIIFAGVLTFGVTPQVFADSEGYEIVILNH